VKKRQHRAAKQEEKTQMTDLDDPFALIIKVVNEF
jgi:predicted glycosyltransferase